ncbi:HAD hydrolase family protein [Phytomonospora sp. NPDC050363]|uniref:HAD family hydrolase n=1 Tax=Phytomonospora sp. NPDC050363 TaxID=3155642 RepID=UPI0033D5E389
MTPPRLLATDLDGTLLLADRTISARTRAVLSAARAAGMTLAAVTARPPRVFTEITDVAEFCDLAICSNGALVVDFATGEVLETRTMTVPVARKAVEALRPALPDTHFGVETGYEVVAESGYSRVDSVGDRRVHVPTMEDVLSTAGQIVKVLAHSTTAHVDDMLAAALAVGPADVVVSHSGGRGLLEISAAGVTKATTLAEFCAARGLTAADVVAFGDMPNDLPMLAWAGRAYAMGNAHPDVRAAVADHTLGCEEDGVAVVLEALLSGHPFPPVA